MKYRHASALLCVLGMVVLSAATLSQDATAPPAKTPAKKAPENLPWSRFHPAAAPYQPTDAEKRQIQASID